MLNQEVARNVQLSQPQNRPNQVAHSKILIVDDDVFNIDAFKVILRCKFGMRNLDLICDEALNGQQAIDKVIIDVLRYQGNYCSYHLIMMDCNMPILNGFNAAHRIRTYLHSKGLVQPVIVALTGHTEGSYIQKAYKSGMNAVCSKPVEAE